MTHVSALQLKNLNQLSRMTQEIPALDRRLREVLIEIRQDAGGEFKTLADEITEFGYSVSNNTVSNYEDGTTKKIPLEYIDAVCRRYNINPAYFFSAHAPKRPTTPRQAERVLEIVRRAVGTTEERDLDKILAALRKLPG